MHHLVEVIDRDIFLFQFYHAFQCFCQFNIHGTIYQIVDVFLVLEHALCVVLQILGGHIVHAILGKLCAGSLDSHVLYVVVVHLDAVGAHQLLLNKVPLQLFDAGIEVVFHKLLATVFVVVQHHSLQQLGGEGEFSYLLLQISAHIEQELIVSFQQQCLLDAFCNLGAEGCLVCDIALAKNLVEQSLIYFCLGES